MWKLLKIAIILLVAILPVQASSIYTDDLVIPTAHATDWPPLVLQRPTDMQFTFDTENFKIHYDTEGINAVYNPDEDENPADGVPDYINRMAEYLEHAREVYLDELGYDRPPPDEGLGGDDRYDIYVTQIVGRTVAEFPSDYYPDRSAYAAYTFIGKDLRNENHPDDPLPFLMATCAHEYFHAVQLAYRANVDDETPWWYELTANWAEERVFDNLNEVYYYLDGYYMKICHSLYLTGGTHMYGAWVFAEYFSQNYGNDIIRMFFERLIHFDNSLSAIRITLSELGLDLNQEFATYACWNYFTNINARPGFFNEGQDFPVTVPLAAEHYNYPVNWRNSPHKIENLGAAYIYFGRPQMNKGDLVIRFAADQVCPEALCLAAIYLDKPIELTTYSVPQGRSVEMRVDDFDECEGAVLSVDYSYRGYTSLDSAGFSYSALIDTSQVGIISVDQALPEGFKLAGNYPNPFNSSSEIIFYWKLAPTDYTISIYDLSGRRIDVLTGEAVPGTNRVAWNAGAEIASGTYFYTLAVGENAAHGRMTLLK